MKWYINEYFKGCRPVTIARRLFFTAGCKRYARHVKHFNSFGGAARHLEKLKKQGFAKDSRLWITNSLIEN